MKWIENHIEVTPHKKPKKITATRFASILGLNRWSTPFEMWCEITKTWQKPFEDTIYTIAGKTIEPKQIQYMKDSYLMFNLRTPTDLYGEDFFNKTHGDFFHDVPIFGGMWDSLLVDSDENPTTVLEFKTTKRAEDWADDIPEYYALQAALYAYLLGVDDVIMIASFLEMSDYDHPEMYVPSSANTITREFKVSERYPDMSDRVGEAIEWWNEHVETGISPDFDEKKDAEILRELRNNTAPATDSLADIVKRAEELQTQIDTIKAQGLNDMETELKKCKDQIKEYAMTKFRDGDATVTVPGKGMTFTLSKNSTSELDKSALEADGLIDKYTTTKESYKLTVKKNKMEE